MVDIVDKATRSRMMSGIRGKDTQPEIYIRKLLHSKGFRFRLHAKKIPGKPDIVLSKHKAIILVHGCFWHGHGCKFSKMPSTNTEFWQEKINVNKQRDQRDHCAQLKNGWRTLVVWECAIRASVKQQAPFDLIENIGDWLTSKQPSAFIDSTGRYPHS